MGKHGGGRDVLSWPTSTPNKAGLFLVEVKAGATSSRAFSTHICTCTIWVSCRGFGAFQTCPNCYFLCSAKSPTDRSLCILSVYILPASPAQPPLSNLSIHLAPDMLISWNRIQTSPWGWDAGESLDWTKSFLSWIVPFQPQCVMTSHSSDPD